ncbi:MAG: hypothetical protein R6X23_01205 [Acidimicrobiia bacterium]
MSTTEPEGTAPESQSGVDKAKDAAGDMAGKAKDIAGDVGGKAKDIAGDVAGKAKDAAGVAGEKAGGLFEKVKGLFAKE